MAERITSVKKLSYGVIILIFVLSGFLYLTWPLLAAIFTFFALEMLHRITHWSKWLTLLVFLFFMAGLVYFTTLFIRQTVVALPAVAEKTITSVNGYAARHQIELPVSDLRELKAWIIEESKGSFDLIGSATLLARRASMLVALVLLGCIAACALFLNTRFELGREKGSAPANLYSLIADEITERFKTFFNSFTTVMGAQIIISVINTAFTVIFVLSVGLPHPVVVAGVTFLCGLLPVVGNLISNTIILSIGFTVSPQMALMALIFLVVIHKLEYFLNSKIIGGRIRNPVWLTLLGLILGEKLLGVPGMVLAPAVLHWIKVELSKIPIQQASAEQSPPRG
jgi:predicted PurR-regulated permease PerM